MKQRSNFRKYILLWGIFLLIVTVGSITSIELYVILHNFRVHHEELRTDHIRNCKQLVKDEVMSVVKLISSESENSEERAKADIKAKVNEAHSIAYNIYSKYKTTKSVTEIKQIILSVLRPLRFASENGYYFATNLEGRVVLFADKPELEGSNLSDVQNSRGQYVIKDMIELVRKSDSGFYEYNWTKPNTTGDHFKKISYCMKFEPFDWVLGAGLYVDDLENLLKKNLLSTISKIRFGEEGYIFVNRLNGDALVSSGNIFSGEKKLWEQYESKSEKIKTIFDKELSAALSPHGDYIYYTWIKLTSPDEESPKTSFIHGIPDLQWLVGAGVYLDDVETDLEIMQSELANEIIERIVYIAFAVLFITVMFLYLLRKFNSKLEKDIQLFTSFFNQATTPDKIIDEERVQFNELGRIAESANTMLAAHQQSKKMLKEKENFQQKLLDDMLTFVAVLDLEGKIIFVNNTPLTHGGLKHEDIIGSKYCDAPWWTHSEEVHAKIKDDVKRCAAGESIVHDVQFRIADGSLMWIEYSMHPIFDEEGKVQFLIPEGRDISDRKKAEDKRFMLESQLRQSQKMEAVGTLAGGIAHDFNNILAVIIGYTDMAKDDAVGNSAITDGLDQVLIAGNRAKELVNQILTFSRQSTLERIPLQLHVITLEVLKLLRASLPSTIEFNSNISKSSGTILANPTQIHQILMNLCTNANHAMEKSGGTLSVELKKSFLKEESERFAITRKPGVYAELVISDTGCGIDPNSIDRIFDPFYTTKEVGKGTGMGLSIIHGIVADYGGFLDVESFLGEGTVFHVYFPLIVAKKLRNDRKDLDIRGGTERILFVDDELMIAKMGRNMLERLGYKVTTHHNGLEALAAFEEGPDDFDLVITDQTMPGLTGSELTSKILQIRPDFPIILCTGYSSIADEQSARSIGVREFVSKPLTKIKIAGIVRKVLDAG
jgi:two-component system, cell cycle sensor histidine kinase and response regulator CckA